MFCEPEAQNASKPKFHLIIKLSKANILRDNISRYQFAFELEFNAY
jgi:hypothetical protein